MTKPTLIEFELTVTEYGGRRVPTKFRYWPLYGSCQISQQYTDFDPSLKTELKWGKWRWLNHSYEREKYLKLPEFIERIS